MSKEKERAGIIPYFVKENGEIIMMFMKPSDPKYGGKEFQIAKGRIDGKENPLDAALREVQEELGIREKNIKSIKKLGYFLNGIHVYIAEVFDSSPENFDKFTFETSEVSWLTDKEFLSVGRKLHHDIIKKANKLINSLLSDN